MVAARPSISRAWIQSPSASYVCRSCRNHLSRAGFSFQQQRFASNLEQSNTEPTGRRVRGSRKARSLASSYGSADPLETRSEGRQTQTISGSVEQDMATQESISTSSSARGSSLETTSKLQPRTSTTSTAPSEYVPAETWEGLQYIGSDGHWRDTPPRPGDKFTSWLEAFPPIANDRDQLVSCLHQALVECLTCEQAGMHPNVILHLDSTYMDDNMLGTLATADITPSQSGTPERVQYARQDSAEDFVRLLANIDAEFRGPPSRTESNAQVASEPLLEAEVAESEGSYVIETEQVHEEEVELAMPRYAVQDESFLRLQLDVEAPITFTVLKRFSQLAGHHIPDPILNTLINSRKPLSFLVEQVYNMVVRPKPKKLADILMSQPGLMTQSNVMIFPRRETPIDKEKELGRWKVIEQQLKDRGLPVTGRLKA